MQIVKRFFLITLLSLISCGGSRLTSSADGSSPVIFTDAPLIASRDSDVIITGTGFSIIPQENIIIIGAVSVVATSYAVNGTQETLTFHLPAEAALGEQNILVLVASEQVIQSNVIPITITP